MSRLGRSNPKQRLAGGIDLCFQLSRLSYTQEKTMISMYASTYYSNMYTYGIHIHHIYIYISYVCMCIYIYVYIYRIYTIPGALITQIQPSQHELQPHRTMHQLPSLQRPLVPQSQGLGASLPRHIQPCKGRFETDAPSLLHRITNH